MYCNSPILTRTRDYCHGKIETAVQDLYDFACSLEYDMPLSEALRLSTLQEKLEQAAMDTEKQEKLIVQNAHLVLEARERNVAIQRKQAVTEAVLLNRLPAQKLHDYDRFPSSFRLGIPEESFDMASASIIDVGSMGLFPKALLNILTAYKMEVRRKAP